MGGRCLSFTTFVSTPMVAMFGGGGRTIIRNPLERLLVQLEPVAVERVQPGGVAAVDKGAGVLGRGLLAHRREARRCDVGEVFAEFAVPRGSSILLLGGGGGVVCHGVC